ncbi:Neutral amino acid transporter A [Echinococcus granulosus]|nr:Neutral amino acid transporter A [Echinococcus granulosus]
MTIKQAATDFSRPQNTSKGEIIYPSITLDGTNMIGVVFCCLAFGIAANAAKEKCEPFKEFFSSLSEVVMVSVQKFLLVTPVGVMFIMMSLIAKLDGITNTFISLVFFVLLNIVGHITHLMFLLLSITVLCKNPFTPYFIAFATTSTLVCMPQAFTACDKYGIPKRISRFVLPFAGAMKSDASAIFIAASCLFAAQQTNVKLDAGKVIFVIILTIAYVTALPHIPSSSLIAVVTILGSIGVDERGASLLFAVEFIKNIFPDNLVGMTIKQAATDFSRPQNTSKGEIIYPSITLDGTNMIGVVFCCLAFGIAANAAKEKCEPFKEFFSSLSEVVMVSVQKFLLVTPVGVMFIMMSLIAKLDGITNTFISLVFFVLLNIVGHITHLMFLLLSITVLCKNPFTPYFIAFATTSTLVCMPQAFTACDKYGIPKRISRFVLPFAGAMKSDASAIFIAASCLFAAQQTNVKLDAGKVIFVIILTIAYVTALPHIPSSSLIAVVTILGSIGVDERGASLLFAVEFINDRLRTGNVALSHLYCTVFTYHATEKDAEMEEGEEDLEEYEGSQVSTKT